MECLSCHQIIPEDSQFCIYCGSPQIASSETYQKDVPQEMTLSDLTPEHSGEKEPFGSIAPGIITGSDGVFRWVYEMSLWKNSTIPKTVAKVVFFASMVPGLLVTLLTLEQGIAEAAKVFLGVAGLVLGIMAVLFLMAYVVVSVMYGGKYCVAFEMDNKGVKHIHMQKQYKKSQVLSMLTILAGLAAGSPQTAGAGLLAGARNTSYSSFPKVIGIKADPKRNVIYVNESANRNQVYAADEDFEAILEYLSAYCKKAKVSRKH